MVDPDLRISRFKQIGGERMREPVIIDQGILSAHIWRGEVLFLDLERRRIQATRRNHVARKRLSGGRVTNSLRKLCKIAVPHLQAADIPQIERARRDLQVKIRNVEEGLIFYDRPGEGNLPAVLLGWNLHRIEEIARVQSRVEVRIVGFAVEGVVSPFGDHVVVPNARLVGGVVHPGDSDFAEIQPIDEIDRPIVGRSIHPKSDLCRRLTVDAHVPAAALTLHT